MERLEILHGEYRIIVKQIPQEQFGDTLGLGFGWGFQIFKHESLTPIYGLVVKSLSSDATPENVNTALDLGREKVVDLLDHDAFDQNYICFRWEPDPPHQMSLSRFPCDEISPGNKRSPFPSN